VLLELRSAKVFAQGASSATSLASAALVT
jgi:hypothetical protein